VVRQKPFARANAIAAALADDPPKKHAVKQAIARATNFPLRDETSDDRRSMQLDDDVSMVVPPKRLFSSGSLAEKRVRNKLGAIIVVDRSDITSVQTPRSLCPVE
jgi:hypothetical protein